MYKVFYIERKIMQAEAILERDAAVTKAGQVSLPKDIADSLGVKYGESRVKFAIFGDGKITISRQPTLEEKLSRLQKSFTPEQKEAIRQSAGKTVAEIREEWDNSEEGKKYYKEEYGI